MNTKTCKRCGKDFHKEEYRYLGTPYEYHWDRKEYCDDEDCRDTTFRKHKGLRDNEHDHKVFELSKILNAEFIVLAGSNKKYYEDLRKGDVCYEVQMLKGSPLIEKSTRWSGEDKHVLIVSVPDNARQHFDGVLLYVDGKLVGLKDGYV